MGGPTQIAIIGAGPYGLSIAAHLRARGISFRIFGSPMESWRARMPVGMMLKSEGFASNLYDPDSRFTLRQFCADYGFSYGDMGVPISRDTMTAYGLSFQQQLVPDVQDRTVVALDRSPEGFRLRMDDGDVVGASQVVVAVGGNYFQHVPPPLAHLPTEFLSHSSEHSDLNRFKGQDVTVIGGGASAVDLAALLHEIGAEVRLVARQPSITFVFFGSAKPRSLWQRARRPMSGIGAGWRSRFFTDAPMLFRHLPQNVRLRTVRTYLGPAGAALMKDRIIGRVPLLLARSPRRAEIRRGRVLLQLVDPDGAPHELSTDHVIAATGYKVDLQRLTFLTEEIRARLRTVEGAPVLSRNFQSSVPGLYFVGLASASCFGPVMRFMFGAGYTARQISRHLSPECRFVNSTLTDMG
jgi:hypothetical protein